MTSSGPAWSRFCGPDRASEERLVLQETRVLDGLPDHRDVILTPEERAENRTMMICVSGARTSRLVLDL